MKSFVHVHCAFLVNTRLVDADIVISVNNLSFFLQSFESFYNRMEWHRYNKGFPIQYLFEFTDYPSATLNKLFLSGIKPDISIISFSKYLNRALSKSK